MDPEDRFALFVGKKSKYAPIQENINLRNDE